MTSRILVTVCVLFLAGSSHAWAQAKIRLVPGVIIDRSASIEADHYRIPSDSTGAVIIRGDNITIDFSGAVLDGARTGQSPDAFAGVGIRIEGGANIVIKNAVVRGYKVGLMATDTPAIRITESDFSYNYRKRLRSIIEREHIDDWMSFHNNENDEWLGYGAAVYLRKTPGAQVDHIRVTGGQNGIMLTQVDDGLFYNNEITFNSGVGIGMYRSSRNRVQHNRLDWSVRGYSHGVYNRGQDSAGILMYEQSSENIIAYNSATHSGDGLFLWGGQSTMDTGLGGCNDNLIYANDFSYAPTNGIEVTFSRNRIERNRIDGCWHGIWGGYSFDTEIIGNYFADNEEHIAIEHGQNIGIRANQFVGGRLGLFAWERSSQPADWGYSQNRDVDSQNFHIEGNQFDSVERPLQVRNTRAMQILGNAFTGITSFEISESGGIEIAGNGFLDYDSIHEIPIEGSQGDWSGSLLGQIPAARYSVLPSRTPLPLPDRQSVELPADHPQTREYILVDEWGPVDFRSPVLWPRSPRRQLKQEFELVGPNGSWRLLTVTGVDSLSVESGSVPGYVTIWRSQDDVVDLNISLEFVGEQVTDRFGHITRAGQAFLFGYEFFFVPIEWSVSWFNYSEESDPRENYHAFRDLIAATPGFVETTFDLAYQWYRSPAAAIEADHFATVAIGHLNVPGGLYLLNLTSDDGVRVWVDGSLVHDDWTYHAPKQVDISLQLGGNHEIRIEHFEINGFSTLVASLERFPSDR